MLNEAQTFSEIFTREIFSTVIIQNRRIKFDYYLSELQNIVIDIIYVCEAYASSDYQKR